MLKRTLCALGLTLALWQSSPRGPALVRVTLKQGHIGDVVTVIIDGDTYSRASTFTLEHVTTWLEWHDVPAGDYEVYAIDARGKRTPAWPLHLQ